MARIKGTPCEAAIREAMQLANQILAGESDALEAGRQIAWLGSSHCLDFLNEVDVVDEIGGFWEIVGRPEALRAAGIPYEDNVAERSEEVRRAARILVEHYGPNSPS